MTERQWAMAQMTQHIARVFDNQGAGVLEWCLDKWGGEVRNHGSKMTSDEVLLRMAACQCIAEYLEAREA